MSADEVIAVFESLNAEGRATCSLDLACAGFADWLSQAWNRLTDEDIAVLTSVGAALYREGFAQA